MVDIQLVVKVLGKLLEFGVNTYEAFKAEGFDTKEITTLAGALGAVGDLGVARTEAPVSLEVQHLAVITRCFGQAFGRHWAHDQSKAPWPANGFKLFMSKEDKMRLEEIEVRLRLAAEDLKLPGDRSPGRAEWKLATSLSGGPLSTQHYKALWKAFSNPKLDDEDADTAPLLALGDSGRREFERHFLLAYHQALASSVGQPLRPYLESLHKDYRASLLQDLLLKDMASWGSRHTFGNIERRDRPPDDPLPFMPLEEMYVEPAARLGEDTTAPVLSSLERLLEEPGKRVLVIKADFGMGKSLTARRLAQRLAIRFLDERETPSPEHRLPIFIRCAEDFPGEEFDLERIIRRAWKRQADALRLDLKASDEALSLPGPEQRTLFILDGLDEILLGERRLESFFEGIKDEATDNHRFLILSRPGALPSERKLKDIPVLELCPWGGTQIEGWLERWRQLKGGMGPSLQELKARGLEELASTPILLLMLAQTWSMRAQDAGVSRAALYEEFFWQIAKGKHQNDREQHESVAVASAQLRDQLVKQGLLDETSEAPDAMLWLMGRVAWEATCLELGQMLEPLRRAEMLTKRHIENLLDNELKIPSTASDTIDTIQVGLLLALQAHFRAGAASQILFGHKTFREFLVARYWADRLRALARAQQKDWKSIELPLLGGRLLRREDRTFEFLMEMLNGQSLTERPQAPFGLSEDERRALLLWAQHCFESEEQAFLPRSPQILREDRRPLLREAALAIGSSLKESSGLQLRDKLTLRTMLSWFWLMRVGPTLIAPRAHFKGAMMADMTLRAADFREANLEGAFFKAVVLSTRTKTGALDAPSDFSGARLDKAVFQGASLEDARFARASLKGANLVGAVLTGANLEGASLEGASLGDASLKSARLISADLRGANLEGANLENANLYGAHLEGANLKDAILKDARYDDDTRWPEGFDPVATGALKV